MSRREVSLFDDAAATRKIMSTRTICCGLVLVAVIFNSGYCHAVPVEQQQHSRLRRAAQEGDDGPLPFIQFTKGGIRVNFGGYHAQAGLGGLLTGRAADGGLHASAGIENGPSASAGLGGSLENGPKGGLHARAGLGGGGPEAEAGLSGSLAGPKPTGDIYSRAQLANGIEVAKTKGKNVQIIPRPKKATEQDQYAASGATAAALNREPSGEDDEALKKSHPARWYFEKRVQDRIAAAGQTTAEPTSASSTTDSNAISEQAVTSGSSSSSSSSSSTNINNSSNNSSKEKNSGGRQTSGIYSRATASASNDDAIQDTGRPKHRSTLFDDIFNIPISALNAVNKLLKNHVGKK